MVSTISTAARGFVIVSVVIVSLVSERLSPTSPLGTFMRREDAERGTFERSNPPGIDVAEVK